MDSKLSPSFAGRNTNTCYTIRFKLSRHLGRKFTLLINTWRPKAGRQVLLRYLPPRSSTLPSYAPRSPLSSLLNRVIMVPTSNYASSFNMPRARADGADGVSIKSASPAGTTASTSASTGMKRKRASEPKFYSVRVGHRPGIYHSWNDCLEQVKGFKNATCKLFWAKSLATSAYMFTV